MPRFHSLTQPPRGEAKMLVQELREQSELKPRLTFPFSLNKNRAEALQMISGKKEISEGEIIKFLKSNDFIEQLAGLYLIKNTPSFLKESHQELISILKTMEDDKNPYIREAVAHALVNIGGKDLPFLKTMEDDKNPYIRKAIAHALGNIGEKALPILKTMKDDKDTFVRKAIAHALGNIGEKALPFLKTMKDDKNLYVRKAVAQALGNIGEKSLPVLEIMKDDKDPYIRGAVAHTLGNIGEKSLPVLEIMEDDKDTFVRIAVAHALGNIGEKSLPVLKIMKDDKDTFVRKAVAHALGNIGEKALPVLKIMKDDENLSVQEVVAYALTKIKWAKTGKHNWLLATQKPLFATFFTKELISRILKLQEIAKKLAEQFKDQFIGLTIFGSTAKGYYEEKSDLDWGIIAQDKEVSFVFQDLAKFSNLDLCKEHYAGLDKNYQVQSNEEILFYGLFFGDHKKLLEIQRQYLQGITEKEWDRARRVIADNETNLLKAQERFNLKKEELEKTKLAAMLLRVPPSYQEMLKILQSR